MQTHLRHPQELFARPVQFLIPLFQRRYVWQQEKQWEPLWDDVERLTDSILCNEQTEPHFMGAVVLKEASFPSGAIEPRIVVDGQQRLITLQLLIDAIRKTLERRGHCLPAKRLGALVQNQEAFCDGKPNNAFKVRPTIVDSDAFRHAMSNDPSSTDYAKSRIVQAHDYFIGQAAQWLDRSLSEAEKRDKAASVLEEVVRIKLQLVVIDLHKKDNPHVIFETLNARGTPLLESDMVRNKILHDAKVGVGEDDGETSAEEGRLWPFRQDDWWAKDVGRGLQRRSRVDVYLNHWLTLRNRKETKPYDEFDAFTKYAKKQCKVEETTIESIATDMGDLGKIYREVEEVQRTDIMRFLERRKVMNVGVITPLLLWLLAADLSPAVLSNCIKALESFLVRRVVCGYSARSYGEFFVGLIAKLAEGSAGQPDHIVVSHLVAQTAQATVWPTYEQLCEKFITAPLYQYLPPGRLRMVLSGIEEELRTNMAESGELSTNLQIEHIMPQAWKTTNWPLQNETDHEAIAQRERAIHSIGNLTLVNNHLNPSLSNASWDSKRKALADHSVLFLNKHLVTDGPLVWDEAAIRKRAELLCDTAVKVWPHHRDIKNQVSK